MKNPAVIRSAIVIGTAFILASGAVAFAAPASQAAPGASRAATGWRAAATVTLAKGTADISNIAAVSAGDAWASGQTITAGPRRTPVIEHWAGRSWQRLRLTATALKKWRSLGLTDGLVTASAAGNVWVVGGSGHAIRYGRYNGRRWTYGRIPGGTQQALTIPVVATTFGPHDTWVFGVTISTKTSATTPYAAQFNGHRWVPRKVPGSGAIVAVTSVSPRNMLALVGSVLGIGTSTPTVVRWNGRKWTPLPVQPKLPPSGLRNATSMAAVGGHIWIGGDYALSGKQLGKWGDFVAELRGSAWKLRELPDSASAHDFQLNSLAPDGHGGLWALGVCTTARVSQRLWHYTGRLWRAPISPRFGGSASELLRLTAVPGTDSIWGAGILTRAGGSDGLIALEGPTPR